MDKDFKNRFALFKILISSFSYILLLNFPLFIGLIEFSSSLVVILLQDDYFLKLQKSAQINCFNEGQTNMALNLALKKATTPNTSVLRHSKHFTALQISSKNCTPSVSFARQGGMLPSQKEY